MTYEKNLIDRITYYLSSGGLFNPELADHLAVRNLLMECKEALAQPDQVALVKEMRDVQGQHGNWNYDPYMQGLYNGLEFAVSLLERREPEFRNAPEAWIGDIRIKRDNFGSAEPLTAAHGIKGEA